MSYPQYKNKHLGESLFNPDDFAGYKKWDKKGFPRKIVIIYQRYPLAYFKRKYAGKYKTLSFTAGHDILKYGSVGLIKMAGIGSPHATLKFEELIARGAREFICIGTAGGLQHEGLFLCDRAIRDEGTSHHYYPHGKYSYPNKDLTESLAKAIDKQKFSYERATTWTIDAPYRETKAEIAQYKKEGVATVDMEASALFSVAKYRKVKIASAFVVSDLLGEKWTPKFHHTNVKRKLNKLIDIAINCLEKK